MYTSNSIWHLQIFVIVTLSCLFAVHSANALSIVATVPVGVNPIGIAYDSALGRIFVADSAFNTFSVIYDSTNSFVTYGLGTVGPAPYGVAYDSAKEEMFVTNSGDDSVSVISDVSNTVVATILVGGDPDSAAYDSAKGEMFVVNGFSNTVSVINDSSNTVVATIPVGSFPRSIAYDSAKEEMFVVNYDLDTVSVISDVSNTVVATIPVGIGAHAVAYDSVKGEMFVVNDYSSTVSVISDVSNTVVATIHVGAGEFPIGIAYDSAKGEMFVVNFGGDSVSVISDNANTVVGTISVGSSPFDITYDSGKEEMFVTNFNDNTVSVISDPVPLPSSGGHDVRIHHPPSLGNDYHNHYAGGIELNGKSFDITNYGTTIPQQVLKIGQSYNFTFKIYDERGPDAIQHVGMFMHFTGDTIVSNSDTSIVWDKFDGIQVNDPDKFFSDTAVVQYHDDNFAYVSIRFTPAKVMSDSAILVRMWDDKRASIDLPINGAIIIIDPNAPVQVTKVPTDQYGDYHALVRLLDSDGYQMPTILHKIRNGADLSSSVDVYWIYYKGTDKLTMVETFKDGGIIGDTVYNLNKKPAEPSLTDHDYAFIPVQNNRQNPEQEQIVMHQEEVKAEKILKLMNIGVRQAS